MKTILIIFLFVIPIIGFSQNNVERELDSYVSNYKTINSDESAAIDFVSGEIFESIPKYCTSINRSFPNDLSATTATHLKNYVKKVCDMYLYEKDPYRVNYKKTIDAVRYEGNNLIKLISKLSPKDKSIVINYLRSLD